MLSGGRRLIGRLTRHFDAISHLAMVLPAAAGAVWLLVRADGAREYVAVSIYGLMLVLLFAASALHHFLSPGAEHPRWQKLDHISIYLMIAGSYTPFALLALPPAWGWSIFGVIWGMAAVGIVLDALHRDGHRHPQLLIYLAMGWLILIAIQPLLKAITGAQAGWLVAGGLAYTGGVAFYLNDERWRWAHGVWHLFVIAGAICHYIAIFQLLD